MLNFGFIRGGQPWCPEDSEYPCVINSAKRIVVFGDIHGDIILAKKLLIFSKLVNEKMEWIAKPPDTILVQVGDQIDSFRNDPNYTKKNDSSNDIEVLELFEQLHEKAKKYGGSVYSLLGNHEIMNVEGDFRYVTPKNLDDFYYKDVDKNKIYRGKDGRLEAFKIGGPLSTKLGCTRKAAIIIGSTLFVHAGILPVIGEKINMKDRNEKIKSLNNNVKRWLLGKIESKREIKYIDDISISPFWMRIFGQIPIGTKVNDDKCKKCLNAVKYFQIGQIVIGHTPQLIYTDEGINGTCDKDDGLSLIYRVDAGLPESFGLRKNDDDLQYLEILNDKIFNIIKNK